MRKYRNVVQYICIIALVIPSVTMADGYRATVLENILFTWTPWDARINELFETVNGLCSSSHNNSPIWFCGEENLLMKKDGDNWYDYSGGDSGTCTDPLYDVAVNVDDLNNVVAVGYNMLATTFDGGNTWMRYDLIDPYPGVARSIVYHKFKDCFVYCRDNGEVTYGGTDLPYVSWSVIDGNAWYPLRGVGVAFDHINGYYNVVAVGDCGSIYYAEDYTSGSSELIPASVSPSTPYSFNAVDFSSFGLVGVAVGDNGIIYHSTDHGISWSKVTIAADCNLYDVSISLNGVVHAVGDEGTIMCSSTYNIEQWDSQVSNTHMDLYALSDQEDFSLIAAGGKYAMHSIVPGLDDLHSAMLSEEEHQGALQVVSVYGTGAAQLRYTPRESEDIQIVLFDISGRVVHESRHFTEIGTELLVEFYGSSSDAGYLPNGLYSCLLREGNTCFTESFVIVR